ncbi:conserved hypothetical protein [Verticillium alfalfae VaMs.102]|uniref:Mitochondrial import receptor subunit tom22 n=1 Tax=Verticillium alfalfae (strain VaMs.102 / ATCC MYA-4576 / FGSC 10136) TaxID=526221 RepID=C9SS85_VERA1|nr:conserved hypothetical protein [Verticillium alfalfae VaMs.102]EEY21650.1 conserved hypothetical protein [Verticillium alfalfae VaMs.102]
MDPQPESIIFDAACLLAWKNKFRHHDTTIYTRLFGLHPYPRLSKTEVASDLLPQIHRHNPYTAKMVQLVEVEDEHFQGNPNVIQDDDADFTDTDPPRAPRRPEGHHPADNPRLDRLPGQHGREHRQNTWYYGSRTLWLVCATALMIGVPLATCWAEDQQIEGMEREYRMREMGGELLTAGEGQEGSTADMLGESLGAGKAEARPSL